MLFLSDCRYQRFYKPRVLSYYQNVFSSQSAVSTSFYTMWSFICVIYINVLLGVFICKSLWPPGQKWSHARGKPKDRSYSRQSLHREGQVRWRFLKCISMDASEISNVSGTKTSEFSYTAQLKKGKLIILYSLFLVNCSHSTSMVHVSQRSCSAWVFDGFEW